MRTFNEDILINAPAEKVWAILSDIGSIYEWNPGVIKSYKTSENDGLGSSRHCDLKGKSYLKETVVNWILNEAITMRITETDLPFQSADIRFTLKKESDDTRVYVSPAYKLKYGILGEILDKLFVYKTYRKGMQALLKGLKKKVEG